MWQGRRLGSDAVSRTQVRQIYGARHRQPYHTISVKVATSLDNCELSCNSTESCTAFSFGYVFCFPFSPMIVLLARVRNKNIKSVSENKVIVLLLIQAEKIITMKSN